MFTLIIDTWGRWFSVLWDHIRNLHVVSSSAESAVVTLQDKTNNSENSIIFLTDVLNVHIFIK